MLNMGSVEGFGPEAPLTIREASEATNVDFYRLGNRIGRDWLPSKAVMRSGPSGRAIKMAVTPILPFLNADGCKLATPLRTKIVSLFYDFSVANWDRLRENPESSRNLSIDTECMKVCLGEAIIEAMPHVNKFIATFERMQFDPSQVWNRPTVCGREYCVYQVVEFHQTYGVEKTYERFPKLEASDLHTALKYVDLNPKFGAKSNLSREIMSGQLS